MDTWECLAVQAFFFVSLIQGLLIVTVTKQTKPKHFGLYITGEVLMPPKLMFSHGEKN